MDALSGNKIWASADFLRTLVLLQWIPWESERAGEARRADSASLDKENGRNAFQEVP